MRLHACAGRIYAYIHLLASVSLYKLNEHKHDDTLLTMSGT